MQNKYLQTDINSQSNCRFNASANTGHCLRHCYGQYWRLPRLALRRGLA